MIRRNSSDNLIGDASITVIANSPCLESLSQILLNCNRQIGDESIMVLTILTNSHQLIKLDQGDEYNMTYCRFFLICIYQIR